MRADSENPMLTRQTIIRYLRIWWLLALASIQETMINRGTNLFFLLGKAVRLATTILVLLMFAGKVTELAGYSLKQIYVFFLFYNLVDLTSQMLYRGVYLFAQQIRRGELDFLLTKPISSLFLSLVGKPDINDALFMLPTLAVTGLILNRLNLMLTMEGVLLFALLLINSWLIVTAFHIIILAIGILTSEVDGVMWLYRDSSRLAMMPVDLYVRPLRWLLFFVLPFGLILTVPAQTLLGLPPSVPLLLTGLLGSGFFGISLWFWRFALRRYTSASS